MWPVKTAPFVPNANEIFTSITRILTCGHWSCCLIVFCLFSCVAYVPEPENMTLLKTALSLYRKFDQYADAVLIAMQLGDMDIVREIFTTCTDP